jgi:hypothetical protein
MLRMAKLSGEQIRKLARSTIADNPGGIRYSVLRDWVAKQHPETPKNTIVGAIWNLDALFPNEISKPDRGLFKPLTKSENDAVALGSTEQITTTGIKVREVDFYKLFAEWLKDDLDEVSEVVALGGAGLKSKWGTPDVVGVYKPLASNLIKFPIEIVSAEIKIDPQAPIVAFGQAIAYRLFSTKTYIAMPRGLTQEDESRLESLCMLFGLGLALFDLNANAPQFSIRVRAQRFSPDMFYVNEFADRLSQHNRPFFEKLFG